VPAAAEFKERAVVLAGAALLATTGRDRFYRLAQDRNGVFGRLASAWCQGHAGRVGANHAIYARDNDRERMTAIAQQFYSDDSLDGFGDVELPRPDARKPLLEQRRAMIVPLVEQAISNGPSSVIEIGTGNGDVIAHLANVHPQSRFVGVDLSVKNAASKHALSNLEFRKGYALDLLEAGLTADVVFASSTFCIFAPKELRAYLSALSPSRRLIISDPVTFGNVHTRDAQPRSRHMDLYMWWHNYFGYLTAAGWKIETFETRSYAYPHNPNAKFIVISAVNTRQSH
jgi:SAM-dependent methyltransferase